MTLLTQCSQKLQFNCALSTWVRIHLDTFMERIQTVIDDLKLIIAKTQKEEALLD